MRVYDQYGFELIRDIIDGKIYQVYRQKFNAEIFNLFSKVKDLVECANTRKEKEEALKEFQMA